MPLKVQLCFEELLPSLLLAVALPCFGQANQQIGAIGLLGGLNVALKFYTKAAWRRFCLHPV